MPMGPGPGGFLYFAGVKFLGYSGYSYFLRKKLFNDMSAGGASRTWKIGGARTAIGIGAGMAYGVLAMTTGVFDHGDSSVIFYMLGLLPVRIGEWWLLLWLFFRDRIHKRAKAAWGVGLGIVVSYALDAIGIAAAFVLPGGIWVC